jgi:SAM-dependent methyltransferase
MKTVDRQKCCYCGQENSNALYSTYSASGETFWIYHCAICRAYFLVPNPTPDDLARAYGPDYYGPGEKKFTGIVERAVDHFRNARARLVSRYLPPGGKVLDIGCGNGRFLLSLRRFGDFQLHGLEIPGTAADRTARIAEITLKTGALTRSDYERDYFDGIVLFHVFEHLTEPRLTLEIINSMLKEGGVLVISLPNIASFQSRLFRGRWFHLDPPRHTVFFKPPDLVAIMKEMGFERLRESYFSPEQNPMGAVQSLLNCLVKKREIFYESLKGNTAYISQYSHLSLLLQKLFALTLLPFFVIVDGVESILRRGATVELVFRKHSSGENL